MRRRIPKRESKIADQPINRVLTPALDAFEQNSRVAELPRICRGQVKRCCQLVAVIEPDIGDQREPAVMALQGLAVMHVLRQRAKELAPHRNRAIGPVPSVMRPIDLLRPKHACAVVGRRRLTIDPP